MNIDDFLSQLPSVADDGFSERVMGEVRAMARRRVAVTVASIVACVVLALLVLPLRAIGTELSLIIPQIAGSAALNFAAAVIVLTFLVERQLARL